MLKFSKYDHTIQQINETYYRKIIKFDEADKPRITYLFNCYHSTYYNFFQNCYFSACKLYKATNEVNIFIFIITSGTSVL